ncbi:hypothetical protein FUMI01_29890 [Flavobacterium sp. UMI-01]|nr:hypothetical protein FUMI01_29890 [Flavobacterium sp. UMI-01]
MEKIWAVLQTRFAEITPEGKKYLFPPEYFQCLDKGFQNTKPFHPKLHTIRLDEKDRWKTGTMIDFFINCRQKDMFRFAPRIPVVSVQEIFMTRRGSILEISIAKVDSYIGDDDFQLDAFQQGDLALNDGFDDYNDFRNYFLDIIEKKGKETGNYWFKGKIIHWTALRY